MKTKQKSAEELEALLKEVVEHMPVKVLRFLPLDVFKQIEPYIPYLDREKDK